MAQRIAACAAAFVALLDAGCLRPARYPCDDDPQCERDGRSGVCSAGWCAYPDEDCPSKLRYSAVADESLAKTCVPLESDPETSSSSTDADESSSTSGGDCESTCIQGPHATAMCDAAGECIVTCEAPWEDCDGDVATGCEVPVGVPHQCDADGLDPVQGCWTAWCGASDAATSVNFGTFYCGDCVTCQEPTAGNCRWCDHATGNWYPAEACSCSPEHLGAVCGP